MSALQKLLQRQKQKQKQEQDDDLQSLDAFILPTSIEKKYTDKEREDRDREDLKTFCLSPRIEKNEEEEELLFQLLLFFLKNPSSFSIDINCTLIPFLVPSCNQSNGHFIYVLADAIIPTKTFSSLLEMEKFLQLLNYISLCVPLSMQERILHHENIRGKSPLDKNPEIG